MQTPEGNWLVAESRRPAMAVGAWQAAALSIYTLRTDGPPAEKADTARAIARAAAWLDPAKPTTTQDRAFQLMGLAWANASPASIAASSRAIAANATYGWRLEPVVDNWVGYLCYGQALYALNAAGNMPATDPVYERGVRYLLRSQAANGTWHVKSRSIWLQPYFESGFPYHDQWISAAGTAWAPWRSR